MKIFTFVVLCTLLFFTTQNLSAQLAIYTEGYGTGITFADFGGSTNSITEDATVAHTGSKSLKFDVPATGYTGGAMKAATSQDLSAYNAVSFWVKASAAKTLNVAGLGNNATSNVYQTEYANIPVTTTWTKVVIPIPNPAKLIAEDGLFHFAEGSDEGAYTLWFDDIQYETVAVGTPTAAMATETIPKSIGDSFSPSGVTCTFPINGVALSITKAYFTYTSSNTGVATMSALGVGTALSAGTTNITATLGAVAVSGTLTVNVTGAASAPTTAAPTPTKAAADVISLFSDAYTNVAGTDWFPNWGQTTVVSDISIASNNTKKYGSLNYQGVQFASAIDVSTMQSLHIDYWSSTVNSFDVFLINQGIGEQKVTLTPTLSGWNSIDIPLSSYTTIALNNIGQIKLVGTPSGGTVYLDNIYFWKTPAVAATEPTTAAPTPTKAAADVISLFSDAYTNVAGTDWFPNWGQTTVVSDVLIATNNTKKYATLNYQGVQFTSAIDVSTMQSLHIDYWSSTVNSFDVFLINTSPTTVEKKVTLTPTLSGWNSFDIPLSSYMPEIALNNIGQIKLVGTPSGGTVYLDNIYFWKTPAVAATEPTTAAPTPTKAAADVISLFSDAYTNVAGTDWFPNWGQTTVVSDVLIATNNTKKYATLNYQGVQFASAIDVSAMQSLHIDYWSSTVNSFDVFLINTSPTTVEKKVTLTPTLSGWNSFDIPLSSYMPEIALNNIGQIKLVGTPSGGTVYLDNIYFWKTPAVVAVGPTTAAPTPIKLAANVISLFSNAYTNVTVDTWSAGWDVADVADVQIAGNDTKKYTGLSYAGIEFTTAPVNATAMTNIHMDIWTADASVFKVKLVDFGADGAYGGGDDSEHELSFSPTLSGWYSIDVPLSNFSSLASRAHLAQLIISGGGGGKTVFVDNVYFWKPDPSELTITNFTVPEKMVGDASFTLTAPTSNSTGAFTYTSSNTSVATISGNTVTIVGAGTSVITATQAAAGIFPSGSITANLIVNLVPVLVWEENFDTSIDPETWTYDLGDGCERNLCGWGNSELEYYTSRPENSRIENGNLVIEARQEAFGGKDFTSARMKTEGRVHFKYGTIEARIKLPNVTSGLWPAFWTLGTIGGTWPSIGEIDMMEVGSAQALQAGLGNKRVSTAAHWSDASGAHQYNLFFKDSPADLSADYHIYKMVWTAQAIKVYLDGSLYYTFDISGGAAANLSEFHNPHFLLLNLAVGGAYPNIFTKDGVTAPLPGKMCVDYIKLYQTPTDVLYLGKDHAYTGNYGVATDNTPVSGALTYGTDADLYYWNNLTNISNPVPYEGSNVWAVHANAGTWFGMGVQNEYKNLSKLAGGSLKFRFKTSYTGQFKVGVNTGAGESWINFPANSTTYGVQRTGNWSQVTIPLSSFQNAALGMNVDWHSVKNAFMFAGDAPSTGADFYIDDVYYCDVPVNIAPTVSITAPVSGSTSTAPATITINATAADADGTVTKVEFYNGTTLLGTSTTSPYSFTWQNVPAGNYSITAIATDNGNLSTTSTPVNIVVNPAASNDGYCGTVANGDYKYKAETVNGVVTITFHPLTPIAGCAYALVFIREGGTGAYPGYNMTAVGGDFVFTKTIANGTPLSIYFTYNTPPGGERNSSLTPHGYTVGTNCTNITGAAPTVSITSPANNANFTEPATITLNATAADADGTVTKVEFYNGTTLLGTSTTSPYSYTWTNVPAGNYNIFAKATDNAGLTTISTVVNTIVNIDNSTGFCGTLANGDYSYKAETVGSNVVFTFHPLTPIAGSNSALIFIRETTSGTYPGYNMTPVGSDFRFTKAIAAGTPISIYFTYNVPGFGDRNSSATPHSYTVGTNCLPLPTVQTVTGGGSYCAGEFGVPVGLSGSQLGVTYQLKNGGSNVGNPVAGTGSILSFGSKTAAGVYTVIATAGGSTVNMTGSATVGINPLPIAQIVTGGGSNCSGSTGAAVGLAVSQQGVTYYLNGGSNTIVAGTGGAISFGNQPAGGTYTILAVTSAGCSATMSGGGSSAPSNVTIPYNQIGYLSPENVRYLGQFPNATNAVTAGTLLPNAANGTSALCSAFKQSFTDVVTDFSYSCSGVNYAGVPRVIKLITRTWQLTDAVGSVLGTYKQSIYIQVPDLSITPNANNQSSVDCSILNRGDFATTAGTGGSLYRPTMGGETLKTADEALNWEAYAAINSIEVVNLPNGSTTYIRNWRVYSKCTNLEITRFAQKITLNDVTPPTGRIQIDNYLLVKQDSFCFNALQNQERFVSKNVPISQSLGAALTITGKADTTSFLTSRVTFVLSNLDGTNCQGSSATPSVLVSDNRLISTDGINWSGNFTFANATEVQSFTLTVTDASGNKTTQTVNVRYEDNAPPRAICKTTSVQITAFSNTAHLNVADINNASTDNGGIQFVMMRKASAATRDCWYDALDLTCTSCPTTESIILRIIDQKGLASECTVSVLVTRALNNTVSGSVRTEGNAIVPNILVSANVNGAAVATANVLNGVFNIITTPATNVQIRATKTNNDDAATSVTTFDIAKISQHVLGVEKLATPYKMIAADVDKSGEIDAADMLHIRRFILKMVQSLPGGNFRFVDKAYSFRNASNPFGEDFPEVVNIAALNANTVANFVAVKLGDVNDSYNGTVIRSARTLTFNANDINVVAGNEYTVNISADKMDVTAFQGTFSFQNATVKSLKAGNLANMTEGNFGLFPKAVTASWNGKMQEAVDVLTLTFVANKSGKLSDMLTFNSALTQAMANDMAGNEMNVQLKFNTGKVVGGEFALYQNTPNPVSSETVIGFNLPTDSKTKMTITAMDGKIVKVINGAYKAGYNVLTINKSDMPTSGVFYYRLETTEYSATKKMVIIE